ncbi:MAG: hypothetical protein ACRD9S_00170 [Pyrinomonadaceae bacterium]
MTKEEAAQYRNKWQLVKEARVEEVRRMSAVEKIKDLEILFEFGQKLGWPDSTDDPGWEYWSRLKELSNA